MKKIFYYSIVGLFVAMVFTSCKKDSMYNDNSYWLSQERGNVVYSSNACGYYVVETNYGYTIIQNLDGLRTYQGDVVYGDFGHYGTRNFYNYTVDVVTRGNVVEYDLSYAAAQDAINYYCPYGKSTGAKIKESSNTDSIISRPSAAAKQ